MYLAKTPKIAHLLYPRCIWKGLVEPKRPTLYLTFDDGPIPHLTDWVLDELDVYEAKATFFCVGQNAEQYPHLVQSLLTRGHSIGNHTYNHLNGWKTNKKAYLENILEAEPFIKSDLFRPPYGRITAPQAFALRKKHYKIIMWDVLSGDFDATISSETCLSQVIKNVQNGSIVVFHDSLKAEKHLRYCLPKVLKYFAEKGFCFRAL